MEKNSIVLWCLVGAVIYLFIKQHKQNKEGMAGEIPVVDLSAIKTLAEIANKLQTGGLNVPGDLLLSGNIAMNDKPVRFRSAGDYNHEIKFNAGVDGPEIKGYSGGKLTTQDGNATPLHWNKDGISVGGVISMNDKSIRLRSTGDNNHEIKFNNESNGPEIKGYAGGRLSTMEDNATPLQWNKNGISLGGVVAMNDKSIRLRSAGDNNHEIKFNNDANGPEIKGYAGGRLSTMDGNAIPLQWNKNGVNINGSLTIGNLELKDIGGVLHINNTPVIMAGMKLQANAGNAQGDPNTCWSFAGNNWGTHGESCTSGGVGWTTITLKRSRV